MIVAQHIIWMCCIISSLLVPSQTPYYDQNTPVPECRSQISYSRMQVQRLSINDQAAAAQLAHISLTLHWYLWITTHLCCWLLPPHLGNRSKTAEAVEPRIKRRSLRRTASLLAFLWGYGLTALTDREPHTRMFNWDLSVKGAGLTSLRSLWLARCESYFHIRGSPMASHPCNRVVPFWSS